MHTHTLEQASQLRLQSAREPRGLSARLTRTESGSQHRTTALLVACIGLCVGVSASGTRSARAESAAPAEAAKRTEIRLVDLAGKPVRFADVQRDATLVAFWMAACAPCIEEMPMLDALHKKHAADGGIAVIGINLDADETLPAAQRVLAKQKVSYPMLRDSSFALVRTWFPNAPEGFPLPTVLVMDRKLNAVHAPGFPPGQTTESFITAWTAHLTEAREGKLREHLRMLAPHKPPGPVDTKKFAELIEKMLRSHHPDMNDADVKKRVEAALEEYRKTGSVKIN